MAARTRWSPGAALLGRRQTVSARYLAGAVGLGVLLFGLFASGTPFPPVLLVALAVLAVGLAADHARRNSGLVVTVAIPVVVALATVLDAVLSPGTPSPARGLLLAFAYGLPLGALSFVLGRAAEGVAD